MSILTSFYKGLFPANNWDKITNMKTGNQHFQTIHHHTPRITVIRSSVL